MSLAALLNPFHRPQFTEPLPPGAIVAQQISHQYRMRGGEALHNVSLAIPPGSVTGLLGLNGAGKSTLLRILFGLLPPRRGRVRILDLDPYTQSVEVRRRVGYVQDSPRFHNWMTVGDTLAYHAYHRGNDWNWTLAKELLDEFELPENTPMGALSKGMGVKAALILALAFRPQVLILDEPTLGLDPQARRQLIQGVISRAASDGRTVIISSHQITEIAGVVDRLAVLQRGTLAYSGPTDQFLAEVRRVRLTWTQPDQTPPATLPSPQQWLRYQPHGREALLSFHGPTAFPKFAWPEPDATTLSPAIIQAIQEQFPGTTVTEEPLGLEEAFIEFVATADQASTKQ